MSHSQYEIPTELNNLLIDFTVSVLVNRPTDLLDYAASYFERLRDERRTSVATNHSIQGVNHLNEDDNDSTSSDISKCLCVLCPFSPLFWYPKAFLTTCFLNTHRTTSKAIFYSPQISIRWTLWPRRGRRRSGDGKWCPVCTFVHYSRSNRFIKRQIIHPKSDVQRQRLSEAIKNILLFRSLEPVSLLLPVCNDRAPRSFTINHTILSFPRLGACCA